MPLPLLLLLVSGLVSPGGTTFFGGGGGGGCCCSCRVAQPSRCGCAPPIQAAPPQVVCPAPTPCQVCAPPPPPCAPPQIAVCPPVQPVYLPAAPQQSPCQQSNGCGFAAPTVQQAPVYQAPPPPAPPPPPPPIIGFSPSITGYASASRAAAPLPPLPPIQISYTGGTGLQARTPPRASYEESIAPPAVGTSSSSSEDVAAPFTDGRKLDDSKNDCKPIIKYVVLKSRKSAAHNDRSGSTPPPNIDNDYELAHHFNTVKRRDNDEEEGVEATTTTATSSEQDGAVLIEDSQEEASEFFTDESTTGSTDVVEHDKCNSKQLLQIILKNIVADDALASKRAIHAAAAALARPEQMNVVCSETGFTYLIATTEHCEAQRDNVICFVYKRY